MILDEVRAAWPKWIERIEKDQEHLNQWELEFVDDVSEQISRGVDLTFKQSKKLREIVRRIEE